MPTRSTDRKHVRLTAVKRIFIDYTRIGPAAEVKQFRTRLFGSERDGLVPGTNVIIEGDSVPDREATFIEFVDDQMAVFSFVPLAGPPDPMGTNLDDIDRTWGDELLRRSRQIATGEVRNMTWDEVLARVDESRRLRDRDP
jgi:hypothetical protein